MKLPLACLSTARQALPALLQEALSEDRSEYSVDGGQIFNFQLSIFNQGSIINY